jgi:tetratricopeptide (TPR) repeat protein
MYDRADVPRVARRQTESLPGRNPEDGVRRAVGRVRKVLTAFRPGLPLDSGVLRTALNTTLPQPESEAERLFALGWLSWLDGAFAEAEPWLVKALDLAREANAWCQLAESAYWLARVRVRLERSDAVSAFEGVLRQLGGSPQATAWFVDLLWRSGRVDRAEHVWKSMRGNKRVSTCAEGPVLEARSLLRRGELGGAIKVLVECQPANGVVWVERLLLLAWAEAAQGRRDKAEELLKRVENCPYPRPALESWRRAVSGAEAALPPFVPVALRDLERGCRALAEARTKDAVAAFRAALGSAPALPFARYALACLGHDNFTEILAAQPGPFLAVRCRLWLALERFRLRQGTPTEWLETLKREGRLGFVPGRKVEHFRRLAQILCEPPDAEALRGLVEQQDLCKPAERRNFVRAAVEVAQRLPGTQAKPLLSSWSKWDRIAGEDDLLRFVGRTALRMTLQETETANTAALLAAEPALQPAAELFNAAGSSADDESWRERVRGAQSSPRLRPLAQALLLHEAARRGDADAVAALLEDVEAWRGFRPGPPRFVIGALQHPCAAHPAHAAMRRALVRWLPLWDSASLGTAGSALAAYAGLAAVPASSAEAPPGVPLAPWLLHQAARAVGRDDFAEALARVRRAQAADPDWATAPDGAVVRDALPELERHALAQAIAGAVREGQAAAAPARLLTDLVDLIRCQAAGDAILRAALQGDRAAIHSAFDALARSDLPPRLAHHLALLAMRSGEALDDTDETAAAESHWRRSWTAWLYFLAAPADRDGPASREAAHLILDALLATHRARINELLARNAVDAARRHWGLVQELPSLAARHADALRGDLERRVERFRDELASDYLVSTREAKRYGDIPEGWRADYEKGLGQLRRLLSLDPQNVRLLTALVEVCGDWFLDLYNTEDRERLAETVSRFTPFAQQLVRLVDGRPGDLTARAGLSEFFKFRGFVAPGRADRVALFREALRLNPGNDNVRDLLRSLGEDITG